MNTNNPANKPLSLEEENRLLRKQNVRLRQEIQKLQKQNLRQKQELDILREDIRFLKARVMELQEMLFKRKGSNKKDKDDNIGEETSSEPKKKGAPVGHLGKTRKIPERVDIQEDVYIDECPNCRNKELSRCQRYEDHYQEDILRIETKITRYRHHYYYCPECKKTVHGTGNGELARSYIGPFAKSVASFLHHQMSMPYRKIRILFKELFNLNIDPTSCVGFDQQIRNKGTPIYKEMREKIKKEPYAHTDETGWGDKWLWCSASARMAVYAIMDGRGQKEVDQILGKKYGGVLISDFLSAYNKIESLKQRCLVHLLRLIKKWQVYFNYSGRIRKYLEKLKTVIKGIIKLNEKSKWKRVKDYHLKKADLRGRLRRLLEHERLKHPRAERFRKKLLSQIVELTTCLDHKGISSHNNFAERLLRLNVIMRKVTFGNRSEKGRKNHETIMSLIQTARLNKIDPLSFLHLTLTNQNLAAEKLFIE